MPVSNLIAEQWKGVATSAGEDEIITNSKDDGSCREAKETEKRQGGNGEPSSEQEAEHSEEVIDNLKKRNLDLEKQKEQLKKEWELLRTQLDPTNDDVMSIFESRGETHAVARYHGAPPRSEEQASEVLESSMKSKQSNTNNSHSRSTETAEKREIDGRLDQDDDAEIEEVLKQISGSSPPLRSAQNNPTNWEKNLTDNEIKSQLQGNRSESSRKELHDAKKRVMEMEYLMSIHRSDLASARGQVGVLKAENGELRGTNSQFKEALQHYAENQQRTVDCLKNQLADAGVREGLMRKEVEIAKEEATIAKRNYTKAEEQAKEMEDLIESHQKDFLAATVRIATLEAQNGELREVNRVQGEMNSLLSQMRDAMQGKVDEQQKALVTFENQLKESWAREGSLSADIAMASAEVASAKKDLELTDKKAKEIERSLKEVTTFSEKTSKALQKANARVQSLEEEVRQLQAKVSQLEEMEKKFLSEKEACSFMSLFAPESSKRAISAPNFAAFCDYLIDNSERALQAPVGDCKPSTTSCIAPTECS